MQYQLKEAECPFIPSTQEILADIMLDAGIIEKNKIGGYLFDIGVPVAESEERKHVDALKFARYETLFVKTKNKPIDGNLEIELEEDEDSEDDASKNQAGEERAQSTSEDNDHEQKIESSSQNETQKGATESYSDDADYQESDSGTNKTTENVKQSPKTNDETIDMTLLFGKQEEPVVEHQEATGQPSRRRSRS